MAIKQPQSIQLDNYIAGIFGRTEGYADNVRLLYAHAVSELLKLAAKYKTPQGDMFEFDKMPKKLREEAQTILRLLYSSVYNEVQHGIQAEWQYANLSNDIIIKRIFGDAVFKNEGNHFARWFARNQQAMDAFLKRRTGEGGLNLSQRIWKYTGQLKDEMELALSVSMGEGESASTVARKVRQYLQEPDRLFRRVRGEDGNLRWSKAAKEYLKTHDIGRGQYLSSYKNAMRLTRTETNMAYRASDHERWQQLDFVLGQKISLSNNHTSKGKDGKPHRLEDICDELQGDYPKEFDFLGWHPQCRCISTPILATPAEMAAMRKAMKEGKNPRSVLAAGRYIKEPPAAFSKWIKDNRERIENASSVPYFIRNNFKNGNIDEGYSWVRNKKEKTEAEKAAIQAQWNERKIRNEKIITMGNNVLNVASKYPDIDRTELINAINAQQVGKVNTLARDMAKNISALNKQLKGMESLIDNPKQWLAQGFKVADLQQVYGAVNKTFDVWKNKYATETYFQNKYGSLDKYLLHKLTYEIKDVGDKKKYDTWKVAQEAYSKQYQVITDKLVWEDIKKQAATLSAKLGNGSYASILTKLDQSITNKDKDAAQNFIAELESWSEVESVLQEALTFQTKSTPYTNLIAQLKENISANKLSAAMSTVAAMKAKRVQLAKQKQYGKKNSKGKIEVTAKELTSKPTDKALIEMAARLAEKRLNDVFAGKLKLSSSQQSDYIALSEAAKNGNITEVRSLLSRLGDDLDDTYSQARKDVALWHIGETEANDFFFEQTNTREQWKNATAAEKKALYQYTVGSSYITEPLRAIKGYYHYYTNRKEESEKDTEKMTSIISRSYCNHDVWIKRDEGKWCAEYRWNIPSLSDYENNPSALVGKIGVDESFMSCGSCKNTYFGDKPVILNIYCPAQTRMIYAEPFSDFGYSHDSGAYKPGKNWSGDSKPVNMGENEIILQRGTKLKITKAEYKLFRREGREEMKWFIDCEVMSQYSRPIESFELSEGGFYCKFK